MRRPDPDRAVRWFDGSWRTSDALPAVVLSPDVHAGVGVFETFGVRAGEALDVDAHLDRLERSARGLQFAVRPRDELRSAVREIAAGDRTPRGWVKLVAYRDGPIIAFGGAIDPASHGAACTAIVLPWSRHSNDPLVGIKAASWAWAARGLAEARRRGADEGLWRNQRGHLTEGCCANLFLVRGRKLFTAAARDGILAGITRAHVLACARLRSLTVHEGKIRNGRLRDADEAFLTSSVRGVRPLIAIDGRTVGSGRPGPLTVRLAADVEARRSVERTCGETLDGMSANS